MITALVSVTHGHCDDGQCDARQCDIVGQRVMVMVNAMITLGSDDGLCNIGQCDDIIVTAKVTMVVSEMITSTLCWWPV